MDTCNLLDLQKVVDRSYVFAQICVRYIICFNDKLVNNFELLKICIYIYIECLLSEVKKVDCT